MLTRSPINERKRRKEEEKHFTPTLKHMRVNIHFTHTTQNKHMRAQTDYTKKHARAPTNHTNTHTQTKTNTHTITKTEDKLTVRDNLYCGQ